MRRWSSFLFFLTGVAALTPSSFAQVYGFPSEVGVLDDGYGTLPPALPRVGPADPGPPDSPAPPFVLPRRIARPACPLVIQVGRGLKRKATTRVVGGRSACD